MLSTTEVRSGSSNSTILSVPSAPPRDHHLGTVNALCPSLLWTSIATGVSPSLIPGTRESSRIECTCSTRTCVRTTSKTWGSSRSRSTLRLPICVLNPRGDSSRKGPKSQAVMEENGVSVARRETPVEFRGALPPLTLRLDSSPNRGIFRRVS